MKRPPVVPSSRGTICLKLHVESVSSSGRIARPLRTCHQVRGSCRGCFRRRAAPRHAALWFNVELGTPVTSGEGFESWTEFFQVKWKWGLTFSEKVKSRDVHSRLSGIVIPLPCSICKRAEIILALTCRWSMKRDRALTAPWRVPVVVKRVLPLCYQKLSWHEVALV